MCHNSRMDRLSVIIGANRDTFTKLAAYSVALFVLSLVPFFLISRTAVGGE